MKKLKSKKVSSLTRNVKERYQSLYDNGTLNGYKTEHLVEYRNLLRGCLPKVESCETNEESATARAQVKAPLSNLEMYQELQEASVGFFNLSLCEFVQNDLDELERLFQDRLREHLIGDEDEDGLIGFYLIEQSVLLEHEKILRPKMEQLFTAELNVYIEGDDDDEELRDESNDYVLGNYVRSTFFSHSNCIGNLPHAQQKKGKRVVA